MPASVPRIYTGVSLVRGAAAVSQQREKAKWPYVHVYPPPDSLPVHQIFSIANPGAVATPVLSYQVQTGFRLILQAILQVFSGSFVAGDASWDVTVNNTIGSPSTQSMKVQGLTAVTVPLGSLVAGNPWPFMRAYEFGQGDLVQSVVTAANAGGFYTSGFFGYLIPDLESEGQ